MANQHDTARDPNPSATASEAAATASDQSPAPDRPREPDRTGYVTGSGNHRLWYGVWHPATATDRGTVVLSHGVSEYLGRYGRIIAALNDHGYTAVGIDHRGHGRSAGRRFTIRHFDDFVRDLGIAVNLAREVSAQRGAAAREPFLFGHSMGGLIATRYVLALPDQAALSGLILSSPALQMYPDLPGGVLRIAGAIAAVLPGLPIRRGGHGILSSDPEVDRRWDADPLLNHGPTPLQMVYQIAASAREVRPRLADITLPLLLFFGEADRLVAPAGSRRLAEVVRSDDLTVRALPGLRHETFNEPDGDEVIAGMVDWLDARTRAEPRRDATGQEPA